MESKNYYDTIVTDFLKPEAKLFKFGSIGDGGYYLKPETIKKSKLLFSGGISSNLEFEFDMFRFNPTAKILMIDPTVSKSKLLLKGLVRLFFKKPYKLRYLYNTLIFMDLLKNERCKHLSLWLKDPIQLLELAKSNFNIEDGVLLKLDIEGSEYDFLKEITSNLDRFSAMVFEFHDVHKNHNLVYEFIKICSTTFNLVHIEINPSGGFDAGNRPKCIEVSLEKKIN